MAVGTAGKIGAIVAPLAIGGGVTLAAAQVKEPATFLAKREAEARGAFTPESIASAGFVGLGLGALMRGHGSSFSARGVAGNAIFAASIGAMAAGFANID